MGFIREFNVDKLTVKVYDTRSVMGEMAADEASDIIEDLLSKKQYINILFAAAPSQNDFLTYLVNNKRIPWNRINAFHMDEYIGLEHDAPQGFGSFLRDRIFGIVPFKSINYLNGNAADLKVECSRYSELLKNHPTDIVFMGIGENGHIAFNDPHVACFKDDEMVKVVELDEKCRQQQVNDGCFSSLDKVPAHALTLTIPALMCGEYLFCIVPGKTKADAVFRTVKEEISEKCPATILRRHKNAILYIDADSASLT